MYLESFDPSIAVPPTWQIQRSTRRLRLIAPTRLEAEIFFDRRFTDLKEIASQTRQMIEVGWVHCSRPFRVKPMPIEESGSYGGVQPRGVIRSAIDLDWNAIHSGTNPVYINELVSQRNLFLNEAAVNAQSGKPPAEFLTGTAHLLNFEDELLSRCNHLVNDHQISEYSYQALRWFRDENGVWVRRRMSFISNFWRVRYLGQDCWMGEVLQAEQLGAFGDVVTLTTADR